jgi:predicted Na+-dependent transporter
MAQSDVVVEVEQAKEADENVEEQASILTQLKNFCMKNFLPMGILFGVIIGILLPQPAVYVSKRIPVTKICIIVLFFTVGLRLRLVEAKSAVKAYKDVLVGVVLVLFVGPIVGTNVLNQVPYFGSLIGEQALKNSSNNITAETSVLGPEEFRLGLQIYSMCPSAPASSLVLVSNLTMCITREKGSHHENSFTEYH